MERSELFCHDALPAAESKATSVPEVGAPCEEVLTLADLESNKYLSQVPVSFTASTIISGGGVTFVTNDEVCDAVNKRAGHATPITATLADASGVYGCGAIGAVGSEVANTFYYKF